MPRAHGCSMDRLPPFPDHLKGRPFSIGEADVSGVPRSRLRRSDVETPVRGVRLHRPPEDRVRKRKRSKKLWVRLRREIIAAARIEHARHALGSAFSHLTAAVLHRFPLRMHRLDPTVLHITTYSDNARRRRIGLRVHPMPRDERRVLVKGMMATHPVDTWCALSALLTLDELVAIGDHLVRRQSPDATMDDLRVAVDRYAGRHGAKRLREALELVRPRTDSPKETELRLILVRAGLPEPEVNISVRDREGRHIKLGDLVYEEERVLVEYDGEQHRTDSEQYAKDARDLERATNAGWKVIRVRKGDRDAREIVARVRLALGRRRLRTGRAVANAGARGVFRP